MSLSHINDPLANTMTYIIQPHGMPKLDPVSLPALPPTLKGRALAYLLITSLLFPIVQFGLTVSDYGFWQGFILLGMAPLHVVYLAILFYLLQKSKDETLRTSHIPWCLTRGTNILFIGLCDGVWIVGAIIGFLIYAVWDFPWAYAGLGYPVSSLQLQLPSSVSHRVTVYPSSYPTRALVSTIFVLLEAIVFFIIMALCIMARRERLSSRDPQDLGLNLGLTACPSA